MIEMFRLGITQLGDILKEIMSPESFSGLAELLKAGTFSFSDELWAGVIYDYALACHKKIMSVEHILKTLTPLYLGKVASFVLEMAESNAEKVEQRLEDLCVAFEKTKPYLIGKWE